MKGFRKAHKAWIVSIGSGLLLLIVGFGLFAVRGGTGHSGGGPVRGTDALGFLQRTSAAARNGANKYYSGKVVVLMYHDVSAKPLNDKTLTVDRFEEQLKLMRQAGFNWITMDQYLDFMTRGKPVPDNAVLLTFDDGYESLYQYAYPLLRKYKAPATAFLIVESVGNPRMAGIQKVTWDQVKEMHANGISFYSHTYDSHMEMPVSAHGKRVRGILAAPVYGKKGDVKRMETHDEYIARIATDLKKADDELQAKLGNTRKALAFPYGDYSKDLLDVCRREGIDVTFTVKRGINGPKDRNGYRVNAGGMSDNPQALIQDMEKGIPKPKFSGLLELKKKLKSKLAA